MTIAPPCGTLRPPPPANVPRVEAQPTVIPDIYRLLAAFSGIPQSPVAALEAAGLRVPPTDDAATPATELTSEHRGLLRTLTVDGRIRWIPGPWGPDGPGYVLTGLGEAALDVYAQRYGPAYPRRPGPALGETARPIVEERRR
ncbi:hypothetical protein, partial [uncultured Deinococcus sp.]|uniref:hypothetical protein n=1 Tax=uncultured Deinococcus sp. TaxID=158789 RepID=UPI0026009E06